MKNCRNGSLLPPVEPDPQSSEVASRAKSTNIKPPARARVCVSSTSTSLAINVALFGLPLGAVMKGHIKYHHAYPGHRMYQIEVARRVALRLFGLVRAFPFAAFTRLTLKRHELGQRYPQILNHNLFARPCHVVQQE